MVRLQISDQNLQAEEQVHKELFESIDQFQNLVFNAGAGAGKTYSLIESLKHLLKTQGNRLQKTNQKIACITYTNAAVNEIKERLGHSELVKVSTIHEMLWSFIEPHQPQLIECHKKKIKSVLNEIDNYLNDLAIYSDLTTDDKNALLDELIENTDLFYKHSSANAATFKKGFCSQLDSCPKNLYSNAANFKTLVRKLYKKHKLEYCLNGIKKFEKGFTTVKYDARFNKDKLHKMRFSHDTLIEYAGQMFSEYDLLKLIIIDSYPYILVDEYQDTHPTVINILSMVSDFSDKQKRNFFVGYFGDKAQHIYDDGIGSGLNEAHQGLKTVNKLFNRRSSNQIIDLINQIRNDEIKQKSIYEEFNQNEPEFFYVRSDVQDDLIDPFLKTCVEHWQISDENPLHCLVLTNRKLAELSGFSNLYNSISQTSYYRMNSDNLNSEFLGSDITKLGFVPLIFFKLTKLLLQIEGNTSNIREVFGESISNNTNLLETLESIQVLKNSLDVDCFNDYLSKLFKNYHKPDSPLLYKTLVENLLEESSYDNLYSQLLDRLFPNLNIDDNNEYESAKSLLDSLLNISIEEYKRWARLILNDKQKINFHTYHSTKGREFDNIVIIGENRFYRDREMFPRFFKSIAEPDNTDLQNENTKNLMYVACSRAKKNLRILYLDPVDTFVDGIETLFGELKEYDGNKPN